MTRFAWLWSNMRNRKSLKVMDVCEGNSCWWWFSRSVVSNFCDPMDCSLPGSSAHGIFQARLLEWVAISFSRGSFWPRNWTCGSCIACIASRFFTAELLEKPYLLLGLAWLDFIVLAVDRFNLIREPKKFLKLQLVCYQYILLPRPLQKRLM